MTYTLKSNLANKGNYGGTRSTSSIKYIVIHYTGNDGDTDENNGNYFKNNDVDTSAHYFVDDDSVTQSVPDNYIAWHCGATKYKHNSCRNANSIGIEICDDIKNGIISPSAKTIENALELTRTLMKKYGIPKSNVIRHFDVTGKKCPAYWVDDSKWKTEFLNKLVVVAKNETTTSTKTKIDPAKSFANSYAKSYKVTASSGLNMRAGAGTNKAIIKTLKKGASFRCYGYYTNNNGTIWLYGVDSSGVTGYCSKSYLA